MRYRARLIGACLVASLSQTPARAGQYWARAVGGSDAEEAHWAQQLSDGGHIVTGCETSFAGGGSSKDLWLIRLNAYGDVAWQKSYGGAGEDVGNVVEQTADGGFVVVGETSSYGFGEKDIWVLKLNAQGNIIWQKPFGGTGDDSGCAVEPADGGALLVLGTTTSFGFSGAAMLVKVSSSGEVLWQRAIGGDTVNRARALAATADGGAVVAGETRSTTTGDSDAWLVKVDADGEIVWQERCGGKKADVAMSVREAADGSLAVAGFTYSYGAGNSDAWFLKISSTGKLLQQRTYGGAGWDDAYGICMADDGGYFLGGATRPSASTPWDFWILRLDSDLKILWQRRYGGSKDDMLYSIRSADDGGCVVAGLTESFGSGSTDAWLLRLDSTGSIDSSCGDLYAGTNAKPKGSAAGTKLLSDESMSIGGPARVSRAKPVSTAGNNTPQCESPDCTVTCLPEVPASGAWGTAVAFVGKVEVTPACDDATVTYEWDFGDGSDSARQNPEHVYSAKNSYVWRMTAVASGVGSCSKSGTIKIANPSLPTPVIDELTPLVGKAGDSVRIDGRYFAPIQGTSKVRFDKLDAGKALSWSETSVTVKAPAGVVTSGVTVTVAGKKSAPYEFVVLPTSGSLAPTFGSSSGGTRVTIISRLATPGTDFRVIFKGIGDGINPRFIEPNIITCTSPPGTGTVMVQVSVTPTTEDIGMFTYRD